jgi:hypothetical protein
MSKYTRKEWEKRKQAMEEAAKMKDLRSAQGEYAFEQAEKEAFLAGKEKVGGFLGFGGTYSGKTKEDFATGGADMTKKVSGVMDKTMAAKGLVEMAAGESVGSMVGGGETGGAVDSALSGAAMGAKFGGAPGAAIGAVAGAVMGAASARAARKAQERKIEAQKQRALGEIAMEEGRQLSTALGSMGARMSASFR